MSVNSYPISANIFRRATEDDPKIICIEAFTFTLSYANNLELQPKTLP